jgi:5-methylcytosine-specific restriction endonuclease McrA
MRERYSHSYVAEEFSGPPAESAMPFKGGRMGSRSGVIKQAARRIGVSLAEYEARQSAGFKWCTACKDWQSVRDFAKDRTRGDGRKSTCSKHYARSRPGPSLPERRIRAAAGEAWCRKCQAWLPVDEVRGGTCKPHTAEAARAAYRGPSGDVIRARIRARERGLDAIPPWWATDLREQFGGLCAYGCGRPATSNDHIWPVARGGRSVPGNLAPACISCNSSKNDNNPTPWVARGIAAHPAWATLVALAMEHNSDQWLEEIING